MCFGVFGIAITLLIALNLKSNHFEPSIERNSLHFLLMFLTKGGYLKALLIYYTVYYAKDFLVRKSALLFSKEVLVTKLVNMFISAGIRQFGMEMRPPGLKNISLVVGSTGALLVTNLPSLCAGNGVFIL